MLFIDNILNTYKGKKTVLSDRKNKQRKQKNYTYYYHRDKLLNLVSSVFEWKNLPDTVDERLLELTLFEKGYCLFFKDDDLILPQSDDNGTFLAMECAIGGRWNVNHIPTERNAYSMNGYYIQRNEFNSVLIYDNTIHTSLFYIVDLFATKLTELDITMDLNVNAQRTPIILEAKESQRLTLQNLYKQFSDGEPVIFGNRNLESSPLKVLSTEAPYVTDKLYDYKSQIYNEFLGTIGVSNTNIIKKERLISDEVTRNMGGTVMMRYTRLNERKKACKLINKMFGLDIDVEYREDVNIIEDEEQIPGGSEDE